MSTIADNNTLPKIALGTWSWGSGFAGGDEVFGNQLSQEQMNAVFDTAIQHKLYLWDTAAVYGMGSSETALGTQLARLDQSTKNQLILSTKFTPQLEDKSAQNPAKKMLDESLARLGVDSVDFYWIHNPFDVERITPYLIELLQSGKVRHVGVSNHNLAQIKTANAILNQAGFAISAVQNHYSLLHRSSEKAGILDYCKASNITFFAYMVLEQGVLGGRYNTQNPLPEGSQRANTYNKLLPQLESLTAVMQSIATLHQASIAQVAIAWAIAKGALPLIGATKTRHIEDAIAATNITLGQAEIDALQNAAAAAEVNTQGEWETDMETT